MLGRTHMVLNSAFWTAGAWGMGLSLPLVFTGLGGVILGSYLPDIDHPNSRIGRLFPFISKPLYRVFGHRTLTHSIWAILFWLIPLGLIPEAKWFFLGVFLGNAFHILEDKGSRSGVVLLWPFIRYRKSRAGYHYAPNHWWGYRVGGRFEQFVFYTACFCFGLVMTCLVLGISVDSITGFVLH